MGDKTNMVRTRIAPSPTGFPHIGTIFQALFNYAFAKNANGTFIVRIEDTDRSRYVEGAEDAIFDALNWFGLNPDESVKNPGKYGPYRQSDKQKSGIYKKYAEQLIDLNHAYYCFCTSEDLDAMRKKQQQEGKPPMYDGRCRAIDPHKAKERSLKEPHVIRMKVDYDKHIITIHDDIRGNIEFQKEVIDDQVLLKSDGFPTYHLAVVIDDHDMRITQVIRGEEWISSTPKYVLLRQYFGWDKEPLSFLHTPLLRNPDGSKLSKRHSHAAVSWYQEKGFLPEAILNYLANLVYTNPKGEIFSLQDFVDSFNDRTSLHSVGARFDITKLEWINGEYIRRISTADLKKRIVEYLEKFVALISNRPLKKDDNTIIERTIPLIQTRIKTLSEFWPMVEFFFKAPVSYEKDINKEWISGVVKGLSGVEKWDHETLHQEMTKLADELKVSKSKLFMDIRIAVTGKKIGPPLFESLELLGKDESLHRLRNTA